MTDRYTSFDESLIASRPNIADPERWIALVNEAFSRRWLTNDGPLVREFEARIQEWIGAKHVIAVGSGTLALEVAIKALGIKRAAIVPAFTFPATAHALQWLGITPIFADVAPGAVTVDPDQIEELLTPGVTAIVATHTYGIPCDCDALLSVARRRGLRLLFDAAHAFGNRYKGRMIGHFGDAEIFSFHATKYVQAIEGGAIVTNNDSVAERCRLMRNFGFADYDKVLTVGINAKLSEVHAAMGIVSLERAPLFALHNMELYEAYCAGLEGVPGIIPIPLPREDIYNYQYIVIRVTDLCPVDRDELLAALLDRGILTRRYFYPGCHRTAPYCLHPHQPVELPHTDRLADEVLVLPAGIAITPNHVEHICGTIREVISEGS